MPDMHRADFAFELHAAKVDKRQFSGYASVFNVPIPSYREYVDPGAFEQTIQNDSASVKVLWQHNSDWPIGKPLAMREDSIGLYVEAQLADTRSVREEYLPLIASGVVDRMSIGFTIPAGGSFEDDDGWTHLTNVKLWEFSPVTFPANTAAAITGTRSTAPPEREAYTAFETATNLTSDIINDPERLRGVSPDDAQYAMALLMGGRGAGAFRDLTPQQRRGFHTLLAIPYSAHGLIPPVFDSSPVYADVEFYNDERVIFAGRFLRKRVADVVTATRTLTRLGGTLASGEYESLLDELASARPVNVAEAMDRIRRRRDAEQKLGITLH